MKNVLKIFATFLLLAFSNVHAQSLSAPTIDSYPSIVDADEYTFSANIVSGGKLTVLGGAHLLAPITDGAGSDELDGKVSFTVALTQNKENIFTLTVEKDGQFSDSVMIKITEKEDNSSGSRPGDLLPPPAPKVDPIKNPVEGNSYSITGSAEAEANIYVRSTDGEVVASTRANANGIFSVDVALELNKTNRFNISAEDAAYNVSPSTQAVIQSIPMEDLPEGNENESLEQEVLKPLPFEDTSGHWSEPFIQKLFTLDVVNGKTATQFAPNDQVTRAEVTKIALETFGYSVDEPVQEVGFSDVPQVWYAPYVNRAAEIGIVKGVKGQFFPNRPITRAETLKILLEAAQIEVSDSLIEYSDVKNSDWFKAYVAFASRNNIVSGYSDGTFRPNQTITRAEVAKIAVKILELISDQ